MKTETPFLDFYYKWINREDSFFYGICIDGGEKLTGTNAFKLICPTIEEAEEHAIEDEFGRIYWGESYTNPIGKKDTFNEFRQTIVLLCAAINGEL